MRITLWVHPRSGRRSVGGDHGGALVVRVAAAPEHGKATDEALGAVADALGVRRHRVVLVSGPTSRAKVVDVEGDDDELAALVDALKAAP